MPVVNGERLNRDTVLIEHLWDFEKPYPQVKACAPQSGSISAMSMTRP